MQRATVLQSLTGTEGNDAETIVVTGTRIAHSTRDSIMPMHVVGDEQIAARGYNNLGLALMQENPMYGTPDNSPVDSQGSFGAGQTFANMFGLGSQRTLTVINGHRFVSGASSSIFGTVAGSPVDLSTIPTSLVKSIQTVSIGGAPTYGSDAIAGVQNFILKDDYEGANLTAQGGLSQRADFGSAKIAFIAGKHFDHDRGGVVLDVEYNDIQPEAATARPLWTGQNSYYYAQTGAPGSPPSMYGYVRAQGHRYLEFTSTGVPVVSPGAYPSYYGQQVAGLTGGVTNAAGQTLQFSPNGQSLVPITYNTANGDGISASGGNGFPLDNYNNLVTGQKRTNLTLLGHYQITPHIKASVQGWFQEGSSYNVAYQGYYNTALFSSDPMSLTPGTQNGNLTLSTSNPFLTGAERQTIISALAANGAPTDTFYMARVNTTYGTGAFTTNNQQYRAVGQLDGDFNVGHRNVTWSVFGTYGRVNEQTYQPQIVTQNFINALNATVNSSGQIVCAPGYTNAAIATLSATCSPINPFGDVSSTPGAVDYITAISKATQLNTQFDMTAEAHSKIMTLPGGDMNWALGYEHRREYFNYDPGAFYRGQLQSDGSYLQYGNSTPITPVVGSYHTHEAFAQLDVPLISPKNHVAGVYNLFGNADARYVNNSLTGGFWTYTAGLSYSPVPDVTIRGNYTRSLRAPSVTELFAPSGTVFSTGHDPCSAQYINSGPNPATRAANCARAGVPSGFTSNINNYTVQGSSGGNPHLKNESADSFTGGLELSPRWIRGLTLAGDYNQISIRNEVQNLDATQVMDACYDNSGYPNNFCSASTRDPSTHQITNFVSGYYNIASQTMRGLTVDLRYYTPLSRFGLPQDAGNFEVTTHFMHYIQQDYNLLGQTYQVMGSTDLPQNSFTTNLNYDRGPLFVQLQMQYYGKSKNHLNVSQFAYEYNDVKQYFTFNSTISYQFFKHFSAQLAMNNIFDARPQFPYLASWTRYYNGIVGRNFTLTIGANF